MLANVGQQLLSKLKSCRELPHALPHHVKPQQEHRRQFCFVQANSAWVHTVRGGAQVTLGGGLTATYSTVFQLPRPGQVGGDPACASPAALARYAAAGGAQPLQASSTCFTQHAILVGYASPCQCWGIQGSLSVVPQDLTRLRYGIALNLADFDVARASSQ